MPSAAARESLLNRRPRIGLLLFLVVVACGGVILIGLLVDGREFQRIAGDDLEIGATLVALDDFTFLDVVDIDIERVVTFRANDRHNSLLALTC
jgi:hypothetical protein